MAQIVAQFMGIIGPDVVPPTNMQELIPYLLTVTVGVFLVGAVFRIVGGMISELFIMRNR
jgi:hypothetical protein